MALTPKRTRDNISGTRFSWSAPHYEHVPLPTPTSIRILELQPGAKPEIIQCKLSAVERDDAPPYEAISYAWGRRTDTRVINCENRKLKVTANLRDALWRIRDLVEVKFLWADAVCINQDDVEERGHQVRQMSSVYANAVRVLVWLDLPHAKFDAFEGLFDFDFDTSTIAAQNKVEHASHILQKHVARLESHDAQVADLDPQTSLVVNALSRLFDSPWFDRLWVVQEIGMAKSVRTLVGEATIDFVDLIRIILRLEKRTLLMDKLGLFTAGKANVFTTFPARSQELSGEVDDDYDFLELLEVTRAQKASDERDYVYALLGHPSALLPTGLLISNPDYKQGAPELFLEVAGKIIAQSGSLRLLSAVHHISESRLDGNSPSWVPNWSREASVLSMGVYRDHYFDVLYDASASLPPLYTITPRQTLQVRGLIIDTISEHSSTENPTKNGTLVSREVPELLSTATRFKTRASLPKVQNLAEAGQTLAAGFRNEKPAKFVADFAAFTLHAIHQASTGVDGLATELAPEGISVLREAAQGGNVDETYWAMSRFCTGRKIFSTEGRRLGLGPGILREGDVCCVLLGAPVPFILRPAGTGWKYRLVGEAYVQGIMKGEAIVDWMIGGEYEERTLEIV